MLRLGAAIVAALLLAILIAEIGLSDQAMDAADPASAVVFSASARSLAALGQQRLIAGDPAGASAVARAALARAPLSVRAARTIAQARKQAGNEGAAVAMIRQAGALGWRDSPTQWWLFNLAVASGDYDAAARRLDALARRGAEPDRVYDLLDRWSADPNMRAAIARRIAADPFWADFYMRTPLGPASAPRVALVEELARIGHPPARIEIGPMMWQLVNGGDSLDAQAMWAAAAGAKAVTSAGIGDPTFDISPANRVDVTPFEWDTRSTGDASATIEPAPGGIGMALHAQADASGSALLARQILVTTPGRHVFSIDGRGSADALEALEWRLECSDLGVEVPGDRSPLADVAAQRIVIAFDIPADCRMPIIALYAGSSQSGQASEAWFDNAAFN